jgi:hypothetical protein
LSKIHQYTKNNAYLNQSLGSVNAPNYQQERQGGSQSLDRHVVARIRCRIWVKSLAMVAPNNYLHVRFAPKGTDFAARGIDCHKQTSKESGEFGPKNTIY